MKRLLLAITFSTALASSYAQQLGLGFVVGVPRNEFRLATEAKGYGLNLTALFPLGTDVVTFGGNINYQIYGYNSNDQNLNADITANGSVIDRLTIPLTITNTNSILGAHAIMRITAPTGAVRPYFEGLFGFRYISTTTKIEDEENFWKSNDDDDNVLVKRTNLDDWILSYGGGGGLQIELSENMYLDFRAYFLLGSEAEFYDGQDTKQWDIEFTGSGQYDKNNLDRNDFEFGATPRKSTTDMLMFQLGLTFQL